MQPRPGQGDYEQGNGGGDTFVYQDGCGQLEIQGVDHVIEVAFGANIERDVELLNLDGTIATYATDNPQAGLPFWPLVFKNIQVNFLGSDDFPPDAKIAAARDLNSALQGGWAGFEIGERLPLAEIAIAHELTEHPQRPGRVVVVIG